MQAFNISLRQLKRLNHIKLEISIYSGDMYIKPGKSYLLSLIGEYIVYLYFGHILYS